MKLYENGAYLLNGKEVIIDGPEAQAAVKSKTGMDIDKQTAKQETIAYGILRSTIHPAIWTSFRLSLISLHRMISHL